ncbi:MAG: lactate racemase domain-containing protein [Candidatus Thorarchaeota archaeon]|jgi:nickel-dependent lactate racemase
MGITIAYGSGAIEIDIPEENLAGKLAPKAVKARSNILAELNETMESPHGKLLSEIVRSKSVCVLIADHTRDAPHLDLLNAVAPSLVDASIVQFMITTGSHEVEHPGNLEIVGHIKKAAEDAELDNFRTLVHNCYSEAVEDLGKTSRGTPIIVNSAAVGHDVYVPLSDMKAHYFAGYSNALKDFLPGVCAFPSIEANHSMALNPLSTFGRHPYHPDPTRRNNPLADDMREAMEIVTRDAKVFTLSTVTSNRKLVWADAGHLEPVVAGGIEVLDETASFTVKPTSRIIVSPGGYPQDKSLYHAQRGLQLTKNAVQDGGEIMLLAQCIDGVAPENALENFYNKLTAPLNDVITSISGRYHLYEHKAYKFAELLKRLAGVKMFTDLPEETVGPAHLDKIEDPQDVVDGWIEDDPRVKIMVLDKANKLAVYAS